MKFIGKEWKKVGVDGYDTAMKNNNPRMQVNISGDGAKWEYYVSKKKVCSKCGQAVK